MQRFIEFINNSHYYETLLIGISGLFTIHVIDITATQLATGSTPTLMFSLVDLLLRAAVASVTIYQLLKKKSVNNDVNK